MNKTNKQAKANPRLISLLLSLSLSLLEEIRGGGLCVVCCDHTHLKKLS